jgi:Fe2+ transport system protein FeoA
MFVYRNRGGALARRPDLARRFAVALDEGELLVEFLGDLTGDGVSELLVRDTPERVRILSLRAQDGRDGAWSLLEKPLWELGLASRARVEVVHSALQRSPALFVLEPTQVLWASFE